MRSIIFTSPAVFAIPAHADAVLSCYARDYSDAHLAKHPTQVKSLIFAFTDGGHTRGGPHVGEWMGQNMICFGPNDTVGTRCSVECDGGSLDVTRATSDSLTFQTRYLTAGNSEECGGAIDLAEMPDQPVSYKVNLVDGALCERVFP